MVRRVKAHSRKSKKGLFHRVRSFFRRGDPKSKAVLKRERDLYEKRYEEQEALIDGQLRDEHITREQARAQKLEAKRVRDAQDEEAQQRYEERLKAHDAQVAEEVRQQHENRLLKERIKSEKLAREIEKGRLEIERSRAASQPPPPPPPEPEPEPEPQETP